MEQVRSFIAIELPDEVKAGLARLQGQLQTGALVPVKWVDPYAIHLTLKFLGNVAPGVIDKIARAMEVAAGGVSPFRLEVGGIGAFPNLRRVQVVWVGVGGEMVKLEELQKRLETNLAPLGFAPESRPFTPHLTLARLHDRASPEERQRLGQLIASTQFEATHTIEVKALSLMKSQLTRQGAIYSQLASAELKG